MKIQRPLFWHQGLFLQPQHLQLQEQALGSRLIPLLDYQHPHFWGVAGMEVDDGGLANSFFHLYSGRFLFPDGSYVDFPGNALLDARQLAPTADGKPLQVYLGLRKWQQHARNVTVVDTREEASSATTRFVAFADPEEIHDLHGGGPDGKVRELHYLLRIFHHEELDQLGDYLLIPLARLEAGCGIRLSAQYVPPALVLDASAALSRLVRQVRDEVAARCRQLEQYKKERGVESSKPGSRDLVNLLALMSLNRHLPHLHHLTETGSVHPWLVYDALCILAGELSTFSLATSALGGADGGEKLPAYDHRDLWHCFAAVGELVRQLLDELTAAPEHVIRLINDGAYFAADLDRAETEGVKKYFLTVRTEEDPEVIRPLLESVAKLSSREHLPLLTSHALPGLALKYLHSPPRELPRRDQTLYFAIDDREQQWEAVKKGQNIALYWDSAPPDLEVELMIVEAMRQLR